MEGLGIQNKRVALTLCINVGFLGKVEFYWNWGLQISSFQFKTTRACSNYKTSGNSWKCTSPGCCCHLFQAKIEWKRSLFSETRIMCIFRVWCIRVSTWEAYTTLTQFPHLSCSPDCRKIKRYRMPRACLSWKHCERYFLMKCWIFYSLVQKGWK